MTQVKVDGAKEEIGARLKAARIQAKVTQEEAAGVAGVQRPAISMWERGKSMPCLVQFRAIIALYGVTPYAVLFGRPIFRFGQDEHAELRTALASCSPSLRAKMGIILSVLEPLEEKV